MAIVSSDIKKLTEDKEWRRKWADRIVGDPSVCQAPMTDAAFHALVEQLPLEDRPIGISVDAQTLGRLVADKTGPVAFSQFLLEQLKEAGCSAVTGVIRFRLMRGKVFKLKSNPGEWAFRYIWLADPLCAAMGVTDKISVMES